MSYSEGGSIKWLVLRTTYRYMAETLRVYSYRIRATLLEQVQGLTLCGSVTAGRQS